MTRLLTPALRSQLLLGVRAAGACALLTLTVPARAQAPTTAAPEREPTPATPPLVPEAASVGAGAAPTTPSQATPAPAGPAVHAPVPAVEAPNTVAPGTPASANASATRVLVPTAPELRDELSEAGYIPGYRRYQSLGGSPFTPATGTFPGGLTPGFGAPAPREDWTFTWSGYMSATAQASIYNRHYVHDGQSSTVFHVPPRNTEEWWSFTSAYAVPGSWVGMNFLYGSQFVTAQVSIDTWNPTEPTTYYQLGTQYFLNNALLKFRLPPIAGIRVLINAGYFTEAFGTLGRYGGGGVYPNALAGLVRGTGESITAEYDLSDTVTLKLEHGFSGPRVGTPPKDVAPTGSNAYQNPDWASSFVHHAHAGLIKKGTLTIEAELHYLMNWAQDDRVQRQIDIPQTEAIDERHIKDARTSVYAADVRFTHPVYGLLGVGGAFLDSTNAYTLTGLISYAGEGERLTSAFLGNDTSGTGKMLVGAINYSASLGRIISYPSAFPSDHPDVVVDAGFHIVRTWTDYEPFNRTRYKFAVNGLYTFLPWLGVGLRFDRVVPNSRDSAETFHVIAPRIQFKTDWNSHEAITLHYAKWFYGLRTRSDNNIPPYLLDDQLVALNFNMWW